MLWLESRLDVLVCDIFLCPGVEDIREAFRFFSRWGSNHLLGICPLASLVISHPLALWYAPYDWGFSHCWLSKPSFSLSNFISDSSKDIVPFPLVKSYWAILKHLRTILHQFLRGFSDLQKRWCCVKSEKSNEFNRRLSNTRTVRKIQQDLRMIETSLQIFQCLPFWNLWFLFFSFWVKLPEMWLSHRNGSNMYRTYYDVLMNMDPSNRDEVAK